MDKKGEAESHLAEYILVAVFTLIILVIVGRLIYMSLTQSSRSFCGNSISQSGVEGIPDLKCDPNYVTLSQAKLDTKQGLDLAVKKDIAGRMYTCWKMVGEGNVDPYRDSFEVKFIGTEGTRPIMKNIYLICDIIDFKDIPSFSGLIYFMMMNKPSDDSNPYFDFIYKRAPTPEEVKAFESKPDAYDTSQRYVVAWRHTKLGGNVTNSVVFIPYDKLDDAPNKDDVGFNILKWSWQAGNLPIVMN